MALIINEENVNALREKGFRQYLQGRKLSAKGIGSSVKAVKDFEEQLKMRGSALGSVSLDALKEYVSFLIKEGKNSEDRLLAIARYFYYVKRNDLFVYLASILGATNVLPDIGERLATVGGEDARRMVFKGIEFPPLGAP